MAGGPALNTGEVQGLVDFLVNQARVLKNRVFELSHNELADLMIGDAAWKTNPTDDNIQRRNNRIRWKMQRDLPEKGIRFEFLGHDKGYRFTITEQIALDFDNVKEQVEAHKATQKVETFSDYRTEYIPVQFFPDLIKSIKKGRRPLIVGPKGCGKSRSVEEACARLGIEQVRIALGQVHDPADLIGTMEVVSENGVPVTKFQAGLLTECAILGKAAVLDEIDSIHPGVALALNMILESTSRIVCHTEKGIHVITPHPNFRIIATANTWGYGDQSGLYSGTEIQNRATWDRFMPKFECGYDTRIERKIISNHLHPNVIEALYNPTSDAGKKKGIIVMVREAIDRGEIRDHLSVRAIEAFANDFEDFGWHKGMYFMMNELNPAYRQKFFQIITSTLGTDFAPSMNDYDDKGTNYIPKMVANIRKIKDRGIGFVV